MEKPSSSALKLLKKLASPAILFYALPWLMILLTLGTLAQRDMGIFAAQKLYFSSWILWAGPFPLPGTYLTLGLITVSLLIKFVFFSPWRLERAGTILTHLGILVLLIGGIITAFSQNEGFMLIGEGQSRNAISDYHKRVLRIEKNGEVFAQIPFGNLAAGTPIKDIALPFTVTIDSTCRNCRPAPVTDPSARLGLAQEIILANAPLEKEEETNLSGATITVSGAKDSENGIYVMMEEIPHSPAITHGKDVYNFKITRFEKILPFSLSLKDFDRTLHPGTDMASGFSSTLVINDGGVEWPYTIRMNEPMRYKGYTFYQASFSLRPDGEYSVLSIVQNKGRIFPYLASAIIFLGLLMHVVIRLQARRTAAALLAFFLCTANPSFANDALDYTAFAQIPVQHAGREKPVDTFARAMLEQLRGSENVDGMSADAWLAETLFDPAQALHRPIFRILNPSILDLPVREGKYYSYADIAPALQAKIPAIEQLLRTNEKNWTEDQRELMRIQELSVLYTQLLRSFSGLLPLNISVPTMLAKDLKTDGTFTVQEYQRYEQRVNDRVKQILRKKGDDFSRYTDEEKEITDFAFNMQILKDAGANNVLLRVIPGAWDGAKGEWFSPWALTQTGQGSPESAQYLTLWQSMAKAYLQQDAGAWITATQETSAFSRNFIASEKIKAEIIYNNWHPFTLAMVCYLLAFLVYIFHGLRGGDVLRLGAFGLMVAGAAAHTFAMALRMFILSRPPVGTLYESIIFVALICVSAAILYEFFRKDGNGILVGTLAGMLLLFIRQSFSGEDSMQMLVAVLNTNFWLGTHVVCITIGYAWCVITSLLAHIWMAKTAMGRDASSLVAPVKTMALVSLLFTAVGTILGGIWADQSWGRFWGWDPKENGALLIILWLVWLFHGQISGHIKRLPMMAGMAGLSIIVGLAWFGVNLLSVGLHTYGFITGIAAGLGAFCAVETVIIGGLWYRIHTMAKAA